MSSPSPEIDPWDRPDLGKVDAVELLDLIHTLRRIMDAEERRVCELAGPMYDSDVLTLAEFQRIYPEGL